MVDQHFGGSWNAHKNWKKLREKHAKHKALGKSGSSEPITWEPNGKGDGERSCAVPKEIYQINFDLAFGIIDKETHQRLTTEYWENNS